MTKYWYKLCVDRDCSTGGVCQNLCIHHYYLSFIHHYYSHVSHMYEIITCGTCSMKRFWSVWATNPVTTLSRRPRREVAVRAYDRIQAMIGWLSTGINYVLIMTAQLGECVKTYVFIIITYHLFITIINLTRIAHVWNYCLWHMFNEVVLKCVSYKSC